MNLPTAPLKACLNTCFRVSLAAILVCMIPQAHAGASNKNGNPYGNGTFFQTTGTFSAVIRGQNLSGTMLFSTGVNPSSASSNSMSSSGGTVTISYMGSPDGSTGPGVYFGNAMGNWDPSSGEISGQFWGGYNLSSGSNSGNSLLVYPEIYNTNVFPVPINIVSNTVVQYFDTNTGTIVSENISSTNTIYVEPVGQNTFQNSPYMNGSFDGHTANSYPNQTFTAQGTIEQQQLSFQPAGNVNGSGQADGTNYTEGTVPVQMAAPLQIPVTVQGVRIADTYTTNFSTVTNSIPFATTTYTITNFPGGL